MQVKAQNEALACIILAAGKGTRMKSALPKVMHALAHRPMAMHAVETARELGAAKIIIVSAPDMQNMREALTAKYPNIEHAIQAEQHGTGDAVKSALPALAGFKGTALILFGDTPLLRGATLQKAIAGTKKTAVTVLGMEVPAPNAYGKLVLDNASAVERIVEAKDAKGDEKNLTLCNSGVMAVRAGLLVALLPKLSNDNAAKEYYLTELVSLARASGENCGVVKSDDAAEMLGVNSRAELAAAESILQQRLRLRAMENGVTLIDPSSVYLASDTLLGSDVIIHPHVVFGPGVTVASQVEIRSFSHIEGATIASKSIIGPFARLRPGAVIGESAHIGNFVEIKQSTLGKGAKANHLAYIGDTDVGDAANIGAGTITCNYDGFHKNRTVIGAGAFIGSNSSLVAPVIIGDGAVTGAGSVITEDVEAHALALTRVPQKQKPGWAKTNRNRKNH